MNTVDRKTLIYKSRLGFWCINAVQGCSHGCRYPCHAFCLARRYGRVRDYAEWCSPRLVRNALELLEKDLRKKRTIDCVHLSLATDPFMVGYPDVITLSLRIIEYININNITCSILTKGILPIELSDKRRFHLENTYGISLVSLSEEFRQRWEPGAAPYAARIDALRALHDRGCRTRVHIEPYPTPVVMKQDICSILEQISFVDHLFFGGWNYNSMVIDSGADDFYARQKPIVVEFCKAHGIECEAG